LARNHSAKPVVVLGFGAAGMSAVAALREAGYKGGITVVTDTDSMPYSPVLTSYYAAGRIDRDQCFIWGDANPASMADEVRVRSKVVAMNAEAHEVTLDDGCRVGYSKLVVATGAHPVVRGFPRTDGYSPFVLRTMEDAERLRQALSSPCCKKVLVSGTSMVGLKALEACLDRGIQVTLLGRSPHIMRSSAHPLAAARFEELLTERGVTLRLSQTVKAAEHDGSSGGLRVAFPIGSSRNAAGLGSAEETERFDEVVLAQGVKPNLDFMGDERALDQGLLVDGFMRTSLPDVYAAGDVAAALDVSTGERRIIGLWQNAVQQGRCAGRAIADELAGRPPRRPFPGSLPCNTIHVRDILFASVGSLHVGEGRCCEAHEDNGVLRVLVYEEVGSESCLSGVSTRYRFAGAHAGCFLAGADASARRRLVGVNLLAVASRDGGTDSLDREIGAYRREVLNSYLS